MISFTLRASLRYIFSRKLTWIILRYDLKVPCRIPRPIPLSILISWSVWGTNQNLFYPMINFPILFPGLIHPSPPENNLNSAIPSGITLPIPMGKNSKITSGDIFRFPLRTRPRFQKIPTCLQPTSLCLPTTRYI